MTDRTQNPQKQPVSEWNAALANALRASTATSERVELFLEERQDLSVELDSTDGDLRVCRGRIAGLAGEVGGRVVHLSDPGFDDARIVIAAARDPSTLSAHPEASRERPKLELDDLELAPAAGFLQHAAARAVSLLPGVEVRGRWTELVQRVRVAASDLEPATDMRRGCRVRLEARFSESDRAAGAVIEAVLPSNPRNRAKLVEELPESLISRLRQRFRARALPSGPRPVVFAPGVGGVLVHEIVGHALEADTFVGGGSWLAGIEEGSRIAHPSVVVVDDPRRGRAGWRLDDEGEPAGANRLIAEGRVVGWISDRRTSRRGGRPRTGHGRRSSYREPVRPRMGCTFLAPGRLDPREVLDRIDDGIYVRRMEAASTNPLAGRAIFRVTDADRILGGRIDCPVEPHVIVVDSRAALSGIDRIAEDLRFDSCIGTCLRDGQPLATSVGGPTFRIGMTSVVFRKKTE